MKMGKTGSSADTRTLVVIPYPLGVQSTKIFGTVVRFGTSTQALGRIKHLLRCAVSCCCHTSTLTWRPVVLKLNLSAELGINLSLCRNLLTENLTCELFTL